MSEFAGRMAAAAVAGALAKRGDRNPWADAEPGSDETVLRRIWSEAAMLRRGMRLSDVPDPDADKYDDFDD